MDLIYMGEDLLDVGVVQNCSLDYEASTDASSCTFQIEATIEGNPLHKGDFIHTDGEEYGGRVDSIQVNTATKTIKATGRSWRGILASKVIVPSAGADYKVVSGNVGTILQGLLSDAGLTSLFEAQASTISITSYQFYRYTDLYSGLIKLCENKGLKLQLYWKKTKMAIELVNRSEYTNGNAITSDLFDFKITTSLSVNHMIGLGQGELADRWVVHKYLDANGNVSDTQTYTGIDEIATVYIDTFTESLEDLATKTADALVNNKQSDKLEISAYNLECDIGDKIEASDITTGITIMRYVTNKILTIEGNSKKIQYKVGNI